MITLVYGIRLQQKTKINLVHEQYLKMNTNNILYSIYFKVILKYYYLKIKWVEKKNCFLIPVMLKITVVFEYYISNVPLTFT